MYREPADVVDAGSAYDGYAQRYDALLTENRINAYMRRVMTDLQASTFRPGERLLELGCGTGDEAIALARRGCNVVAVDASAEMIHAAQRKAEEHSLQGRLTFLTGYARSLDRLLHGEPRASFDGAYSSFALSYEPDLGPVAAALTTYVRPGGRFLVSAMNRFSLSEWGIAMTSLHPGLAGRRLRAETVHKVGAVFTRVYPRTSDDLAAAFAPGFAVESMRGLAVALPPHYANRALSRWPTLVDALSRVDAGVGRWTIMNRLGDHIVLTMRRAAAIGGIDPSG